MLPRLCVCLCKCVQVCASACVCVAPWRHQSKDGPSSVTSSFTEAPPLPSLSLSLCLRFGLVTSSTNGMLSRWMILFYLVSNFILFVSFFFFLCDFGLEIFFESWFFFYLSFSPFHIFHLPLAASAVDWVSPFAAARRCRSPTGTAWNSSCYYYYCQFSLHLNLSEWNSIPSWKERERERENLN